MSTAAELVPRERGEKTPRLLSRVQTGMAVRVKRILATPDVSQRLREMGFGEDCIIRLVTRQASLICQVRNARLAFSERLAELILVEPLEGPLAT